MNNQNTNTEERLALIEKSIQELKERHNSLVMMIVEGKLGGPTAHKSTPVAQPLSTETATKPALFKPFPSQPENEPQETSPILFPIISVICFVLAAVFIVKMAYDAQWLTPPRQLGLLFTFGFILASLGRFYETIENEYRGFLSSAGSIVLFIASISSSTHFRLFSTETSILFCLIISFLSIYLADFHKSQLLSIITVIGTYLSPIMLGRNDDLILLSTYFVFCAIAFTQIALFFESRTISLIASYLGIGVYSSLNMGLTDPNKLLVVIGVLIAQFMIFSFGVYDYSMNKKQPMTNRMAIFHSPVLVLFYGCSYFFLDRIDPKLAPWIGLAFAGFVFALYQGAKKRLGKLESGQVIFGFIFFILFHAGYLQLMPDQLKIFIIPTVLIGLLFWDGSYAESEDFKFAKLFVGLIFIIEIFSLFGHLLSKPIDIPITVAATIIILVGYAHYFRSTTFVSGKEVPILMFLHLTSVMNLYRICFDWGSIAVSVAWVIYAGIILGIGFAKQDRDLAKSSTIVLLIASAKALVYDASQASALVRIANLIITGAVLYVAGLIFKKVANWKKI